LATDYAILLREALRQGFALEAALAVLREKGASIIDSVKVVREVTGMSLVQAKQAVDDSRLWSDS